MKIVFILQIQPSMFKSVWFEHLRHAYDFCFKKSQNNIIICWYFLIFYKARRRNLLVPKVI